MFSTPQYNFEMADIVRALLAAGARANAHENDNVAPLQCAASSGNADIVRVLLAAGARVDEATIKEGHTPLFRAAVSGRADIVRVLLAEGANVNADGSNAQTPLHAAVGEYAAYSAEVVRELLKASADTSAQDRDYETPLYAAVRFGRVEAVQMLVEAHASVEGKNWRRLSPLHLAGAFGMEQPAIALRNEQRESHHDLAARLLRRLRIAEQVIMVSFYKRRVAFAMGSAREQGCRCSTPSSHRRCLSWRRTCRNLLRGSRQR
jgi:ankyrin repeat protein